MSEPILKSYYFSNEAIRKLISDAALEEFNTPQINVETGKGEREPTTVLQVTIENRARGDKIAHVLYREGSEEYAD